MIARRRKWRVQAVWSLTAILAVAGPAGSAWADAAASSFRVRSVEGQTLELAGLLEKGPVLLDFWATWCKPCLSSLPEIEELHRKYARQGLTVIGVSIDGPRNFPKVRPFARRLGLTYAIVLDDDGLMQGHYQVRSVPTSILIAPDGTIVTVIQGYRPGEVALLDAEIAKLMPSRSGEGR